MPTLDLTDFDEQTAAMACRAMAHREREALKLIDNPTMRAPAETTVKRAATLAEKFARARKASNRG